MLQVGMVSPTREKKDDFLKFHTTKDRRENMGKHDSNGRSQETEQKHTNLNENKNNNNRNTLSNL